MRSPARSRAPNALAPPPGRRQVRPVVIKYHVPEVPDREVQFADGLLDFPGRTVIADQPRHGFQRQSRREQPARHGVVHAPGELVAILGRAQDHPRRADCPPVRGPRVGWTPASSPGIPPSQDTLDEVSIAEAPWFPSGRDWPYRQGPGRRGTCTLAVARCRLFADTYYSELTPASSPWRHVLFVAIVSAAAFVKLLNQAPRFPSAGLHQAYTICSVAGDLKINETVDLPDWLVSMTLPRGIFA